MKPSDIKNTMMLEKQFTGKGEVKGFNFKQLLFEKGVYLYEVEYEGCSWYEAFEHRINTQFGNVIYPSSKVFGLWAHTSVNYERSLELVDILQERVKSRETGVYD